MKIAVLGGGALGLTAAYELGKLGHQTVVIEKEETVGGLAAGFSVGPSYLEKFYHHVFRTDRVVVDLLEELGLGAKMEWLRPKTSTLVGGNVYQLDSPVSVLQFSPLGLPDRLRLGAALAYLKVQRDYRTFEGTTAAAWIQRWMGKRTYETIWRPLLSSKFGAFYEQVAMPWFWSRVHLRTPALGYVRGGFQQLYLTLAERIRLAGGAVELGETVTRIEGNTDGSVTVETDLHGERQFDQVLCTLPTRLFIRLACGVPDDYRARYDWGSHHGAHCVILETDRQLLRDGTYWLNVNDPGYPFLAVVEHTNMIPPEDYGGRRLIYLGNYLPMSHRYFSQDDDVTIAEFLPHLRRLNPEFDESWVRNRYVFKAPFAQPIVTVDYHEHIPPHTTPIRNLFLANMFMVYPQDRGQNYSIAMAQRVAKLMVQNVRDP